MKLIHLSDLHLGKRVNEISMIEDQEYILRQILQIIKEEKPEAVMLSGDIYDKSIPSAEAVTVFDGFLNSLAELPVQVFAISGNHDSPERLSFGNRLMEGTGIHIAPVYNGTIAPITISDEYGPVHFWLLPFVKPAHVKRFYPDDAIETYTDALRVAIEKMKIDSAQRNVLLTHQFVTGSATCESEEISVGGSDQVDVSVFDGFDYVALGHLHGPQNVGSHRVRYCGTPLKYSFSEAGHYKSVTVVNLSPVGELELHTVPLTPLHDLRIIRGSFTEVIQGPSSDGIASEDYLQVILTDEDDIPEAIGKLRTVFPNIMKLTYDNTRTRTNQMIEGANDVEQKSPLQLFEELYEQQNNQPMSDEQRSFAQKLMETIWEEMA